MGDLETKSKKRLKRKNLQMAVLRTIAAVGLLSVALVVPNTVKIFKSLGLVPGKRQMESIARARKRLVQKGLLSYQGNKLSLTQKGEAVLRRLELSNYKIEKPRRWDGRWRVLIFDIKERRKNIRERVREILIAVGFTRLQDSVWLYPYDCEELIVLLKSDLKIGKDVLYLIVDTLEYDQPYRKHFNLSESEK